MRQDADSVGSVLLVDAENVIGPSKPRLPLVRARVQAVLAAAGPVDHAVACFSQSWPADDTIPSALIELGVVPWVVSPGPDAAELALIGHARYLATPRTPAAVPGRLRRSPHGRDWRVRRTARVWSGTVIRWQTGSSRRPPPCNG